MIISSRDLPAYLNSVTFPTPLYDERGGRVMRFISRRELQRAIQAQAVHGSAAGKRLKQIRLTSSAMMTVDEDNQTHFSRENLKYAYREKMENQPYTVKRVGPNGEGHRRWGDKAKFAPRRFNPDRIPGPLIRYPHLSRVGEVKRLATSAYPLVSKSEE